MLLPEVAANDGAEADDAFHIRFPEEEVGGGALRVSSDFFHRAGLQRVQHGGFYIAAGFCGFIRFREEMVRQHQSHNGAGRHIDGHGSQSRGEHAALVAVRGLHQLRSYCSQHRPGQQRDDEYGQYAAEPYPVALRADEYPEFQHQYGPEPHLVVEEVDGEPLGIPRRRIGRDDGVRERGAAEEQQRQHRRYQHAHVKDELTEHAPILAYLLRTCNLYCRMKCVSARL